MEKIKKTRAFAAVLIVAALTYGCSKEQSVFDHAIGSQITFGASTSWLNDALTRTEYSGEDENGDSMSSESVYERIDWVVGKDRIRILCDAAGGGPTADYALTGTLETIHERSSAQIYPVSDSGHGLQWGTGNHYFYAWYPAPGMEAKYEFGENGADKYVSSSNSKIESTTPSTPGASPTARVTGKIPDTQTVFKVGDEYKANMNYAYMYAAKKASPSESGSVLLLFNPLVTTLEFSLVRVASDDINKNLTRLELTSTDATLTGTFTADLSINSGGEPAAEIHPTAGTLGNKITINLPLEEGQSVPGVKLSDTPLKVTFLMIPVNQTHLTLTLYFGADYATKRTIVLKKEGVDIVVNKCKKFYIRNLAVPNTATQYYDLDAVGDVSISGADVMEPSSHSVTINTEKDNRDGYTGIDRANNRTPWQAYYVDGSQSRPAKGTVVTGNANYSTTPPSWLTVTSGGSGSGQNDLFQFTVAGAETVEDADANKGNSGGAMTVKLRQNNLGTVDLSKRDFLNKGTFSTAETANCYIVDGYGTFLIPLVYGNAYKNGNNTGAYTRTESTDARFLRNFVNADGNSINSPYILSDSNLSKPTPYNACVVWQDTKQGYEIVKDSDIEVLTSQPSGAAINCAYIRFKIWKDNIRPGNIIIALRDANNKILWSWHIWVRADITSSDATTVKNDYANQLHKNAVTYVKNPGGNPLQTGTVNFLSEPLGWVPPIKYKGGVAEARSCWVAVVSTETKAVIGSFKVSSGAYTRTDLNYDNYTGTDDVFVCTYYQFGRKDPFLPSNGVRPNGTTRNKTFTSEKYTQAQIIATARKHQHENMSGTAAQVIAKMIKNPFIFNTVSDWNTASTVPDYVNIWNGSRIPGGTEDVAVTKTVYDPCPRGFTVPRTNAFTGMTKLGTNPGYVDGNPPSASADRWGTYIYAGSTEFNTDWSDGIKMTSNHTNTASTYTVFIPAQGWRTWGNGEINFNYPSTNTYHTVGDEMYYWTGSSNGTVNTNVYGADALNASKSITMPTARYRLDNGFTILPAAE